MALDISQTDRIAALKVRLEMLDISQPKYDDRIHKSKVWTDIVANLKPNWDQFSRTRRSKGISAYCLFCKTCIELFYMYKMF